MDETELNEIEARAKSGNCIFRSATVIALVDEVRRLRAALTEIEKGEGAFSLDRLTHASNCVENMKAIAKNALEGGKP